MWWLPLAPALAGPLSWLADPAAPAPSHALSEDGRARVLVQAPAEALRARGATVRHGPTGQPLGRLGWTPVTVDRSTLAALAAEGLPLIADRPVHLGPPPTQVTGAQIGVQAARSLPGGSTGLGVRIADIDTHIEVTHPHFFRADAGSWPWVDVDGDGVLTPGVDGLDLDGDGAIHTTEVLWRLEGWSLRFDWDLYAWVEDRSPGLNPARDWLYLDLDGDGERGAGWPDWTDQDPGLAEPTFVPDDVDGDGRIGPDERVWQLGSSAIEAVFWDGEVFHRGQDLTDYDRLTRGADRSHGTGVSGIALGGQLPAQRDRVGLAPEADLVFVSYSAVSTLFEMVDFLEFVAEHGADVALHEYAPWTGWSMDGSSVLEQLVDALAADGMAQVCAAGNLADAGKHTVVPVQDQALEARFTLAPNHTYVEIELHPQPPVPVAACTLSGPGIELPLVPPYNAVGEVHAWTEAHTSPAGQRRHNAVVFDPTGLPPGPWQLDCQLEGPAQQAHVYVADAAGWSRGAVLADEVRSHTLGVPATARGCLAVAAYAGRSGDASVDPGQLRTWSSRGPALGGQKTLDLAAPDDALAPAMRYDASYDGAYMEFGGTSGAAPHAAAVAALVKAARPEWSGAQIRDHLMASAAPVDPPSPDGWGMGKLDAWAALGAGERPEPLPPAPVRAVQLVDQFWVLGGDEVRWDLDYDGSIDFIGPSFPVPAGGIARVDVLTAGQRVGGLVVRGPAPSAAPPARACGCATPAGPGGSWVLFALAAAALWACTRPSPTLPPGPSDADADTDADTDTDTDTDADTDTDPACAEDLAEPNDTLAQALPSTGGTGLWVRLGAPDFWSFTAGPGQRIEAVLSADPLQADVDIYLLDAQGQVVGQPGASPAAVETATACNPAAHDQTWYAYVEVWANSPGPCGRYDWTLSATPDPAGCGTDPPDTDPPDTDAPGAD